jgi:hypothetical protein
MSARSPIAAYLDRLERELRMKRVPRRRLLAEAEDHLRSSAEELAETVPPEEAAQIAVERFGAAAVVARRFAQAVASRTARRSFGWASLALILYGAATVVFAATAAPQFDDFPQGAPTALAGQVAFAVLAITAIRALRWRREPVLPEDRLRLIANGSVIASAALFSGLLLEAAVALTRPAGVLPWSEAPLVLVLFTISAVAAGMASVVAVAASARSATLAAVPGGESEPDLTLSVDFAELFPSLRRVGEFTFARPRRLVALVAALAFCATTANQWFGTDVAEHASIVLPGLVLGVGEVAAIVAGYALFGRSLGIRPVTR